MRLLLDTLSQVGESQTPEDGDGSSEEAEEASQEEAAESEGTEDSDEIDDEDGFVDDPESISQEVRDSKEYKGLQRAYQKKLDILNADLDKVRIVNQLASDPAYRREFVKHAANGTGLKISEEGAGAETPEDLVSIARQALPEGYAEAIPGLDAAIAKVVEATVTPMKKEALAQAQSVENRVQQQEWKKSVERMNAVDPEWEDDSEEMGALSDWLRGTEMTHPIYGDRLQVLRKLVKGDGAATVEAVRRIGGAARNKTQTRQGGGAVSIVDIHKKIAGLERSDDKWAAAAEFADTQLSKKGR